MKGRIFAIDPGSNSSGYALLSENGEALDWGIIKMPKLPLHRRLFIIGKEVRSLISQFSPAILAIEEQFIGRFKSPAIALIQVRGVVVFVAQDMGLDVREYSITEIKKTCCGMGQASKKIIISTISHRLSISVKKLSSDSADALAIALCCLTDIED